MKIYPTYLLISLLITLFILYLIYPSPVVIVRYPNIKDKISALYEDDEGVCYRYHRKEIN